MRAEVRESDTERSWLGASGARSSIVGSKKAVTTRSPTGTTTHSEPKVWSQPSQPAKTESACACASRTTQLPGA